MGYTITSIAILLVLGIMALAFVNMPPARIANAIRAIAPWLLIGLGVGLMPFGRAGLAMPMIILGGMWLMRNRKNRATVSESGNNQSTVRSAWLEMELDHDTGNLDGIILTGDYEGQRLSDLDSQIVLDLYEEMLTDAESVGLMEAYLDRRMPFWRDNTQSSDSGGHGNTASSGPMTKEEAYQILGLAPGAGSTEIKAAHRRLMKAVHPDSGGSTFLAARINEAKDTLLN